MISEIVFIKNLNTGIEYSNTIDAELMQLTPKLVLQKPKNLIQ